MIYGIKIFFKIYKYTAHIIIISNILLNAFNTIYYYMIRGITWSNAKLSVKNNIIFLKKRVNMLVNTFFKCVTHACNPFLLRNQSCRNFTFWLKQNENCCFLPGIFAFLRWSNQFRVFQKVLYFYPIKRMVVPALVPWLAEFWYQ